VPARAARSLPTSLAEAVDRSASPEWVTQAVERIRANDGESVDALEAVLADAPAAQALVAVTAASRSLARLLAADPAALAVLRNLDERHPPPPGGIDELVRWKQHELLRIAARDLTSQDHLEQTVAALSDLAADVLQACVDLADSEGLAVIGMGKLGGHELNYASDVDVMFVGDGAPDELGRAARRVMELARHCFRIDANLRPEGRDGKLVRTLDSYEAYWDRWAQPWEFQALLKERPVAGDLRLGRRFHDAAQRWLWSRPFGADELRQLRHLKERAEAEIARRGLSDREVKRGPGGIRDIEFTAQLLQLVHGQLDTALRSPTTLDLLAELGSAGYVADDDTATLREAYRFLRAIEHRLQLVDEQQLHTVPADDEARDHLGRVLGFRPNAHATAAAQFDGSLRRVQNRVRSIHERVYFRPLLEAFVNAEGELSPEAAEARLVAFGFTDAKRTQAAVRELTRGLNRSSRLMQQMLPLLLDWLSVAPDPDLGLLVLRNLLTGPQRRSQLVEAFRESPEVARTLCVLVGTSRLIGDALQRNPDLVARLPYPERLRTRPRAELVESAAKAVGWRPAVEDRQEALRRWKERHLLGIQVRDVRFDEPVGAVGHDLSVLAEASIETALAAVEPTIPFAVVALGRLGGASLSYASDLDVIFVYEGEGAAAFEEGDRLAKQLLRFVNGVAPAERIYEIDAKLRPEGNQGPMARSLGGYQKYFERWAQVWERQAYLRARPVAGDADLGQAFLDQLEPYVWAEPLSTEEVREIRRMKARVEHERMPVGEDPKFHLKLGRGSLSDIEWTAQLLQLQHGIRATGTIPALEAVRDAGRLDGDDASILIDTYEFLERTRDRLFLVNSAPSDSLPTQPEALMWLARSMGTNAAELREHYRRVTRRARRVVERVFYGREPTVPGS
jgi:glutamate-ammonia-ligase adenylyltransferase